MPGRIVVCRVIPNPGVGMLNLFMSLLLCVLNGSCSRRPGLTPFRQEHTRDSFPCTVLTLRKVLLRRCYNGTLRVRERAEADFHLPPRCIAMNRSPEQTHGHVAPKLRVPGGASDGVLARTYT